MHSRTSWLALASLSTSAFAGNVHVVSPSGPHTQIQSAVDAASDYDTILVKPHPSASAHYGAFTVHGKSLAIVGDPGPGQVVRVRGEIGIDSTPAEGLLLLARLDGGGYWADSIPYVPPTKALRTGSNLGSLRVESCTFKGLSPVCVWIEADADAQFVACQIDGGDNVWPNPQYDGRLGNGVYSRATALRFFGCAVTGGNGGTQTHPDPEVGIIYGGDGGDAVEIAEGLLFATDSSFIGGPGGPGSLIWCPEQGWGFGGDGGDGLVVGHGVSAAFVPAEAFTLSCSLQAGLGGAGGTICSGPDGVPGMPVRVQWTGSWQNFANGQARYLSGVPLADANSTISVLAKGKPGDRVYVRAEEVGPRSVVPPAAGTTHAGLGAQTKPRLVFLGVIPASGTLATTLPAGALPAGADSKWLRLHSTFVLANGTVAEGNDFLVAVVDAAF